MFDWNDPDACGVCHDGSDRSRPPRVNSAALGAPACTTCHVETGGPLACSTCHGVMAPSAGLESRAYPPRDRCFYPASGPADERTHAAHVNAGAIRSRGIDCSTCHVVPALGEIADRSAVSTHANGVVDVRLDTATAGGAARVENKDGLWTCFGTCHDRGGSKPTPSWTTGSTKSTITCNDCHTSPPQDHYPGACTTCHHEADATGTQITPSEAKLHINGKVDLGDGSGKCGACHGNLDDPWPSSGAHSAHKNPKSSAPVACETCHEVPADLSNHPQKQKVVATVRLSGLAARHARRPSYDAATKTCAGTYCHEGRGGSRQAPSWTDPLSTSATCTGSCHALPPSAPHAVVPVENGCGTTTACHGGSTAGGGSSLAITPAGRAVHVDGKIDRGL